ncbi:MAG: nucleotidyltransferase domain-containing protein [Anaerolineales bacterium]|nr:nucleotidyltransferase domain-containing protein [Anaerolineales bacterium]MDW8162261.1 nucleotidyltransferase domain-containing protein [Anaerolineales bacterium]
MALPEYNKLVNDQWVFPAPYNRLIERLTQLCHAHYGERLVSLVIYGSLGRGTATPESDVDLLIVAENLPKGRIPRVQDFLGIEWQLREEFNFHFELSPVFKTPAEVQVGSPLFLDMTEDAILLFDRNRFFERFLESLRERLRKLGAKRVWLGNAWYWDLKPDYRPGEVFET